EQFAAAEGRIALTQTGGALSAAPAGGRGSGVYAPNVVENEQPKVGGALKAVMALAGAGPSMTGWVGAQSLLAPRGAGEERDECVIEPGSEEMFAAVAAGSEEKLFVLANE